MQAMILNMSAKRMQCLLDDGDALVGFLPEFFTRKQLKKEERTEAEEMSV